jgi:signal transduction histidine kinase
MPSQKKLQEIRRQEALGRISPAIAHDINNLLSGILGYSQLCLHNPAVGNLKPFIEEIERTALRIASLAGILQVFSRMRASSPERVDLNNLIRQMEKYLSLVVGDGIRLKISTVSQSRPVLTIPSMIRQAFLILSVEIRNKMPGGGSLLIETAADADCFDRHSGESAGISITFTIIGNHNLRHSPTLDEISSEIPSSSVTAVQDHVDFNEIIRRCGGHAAVFRKNEREMEIRIAFPVADGSEE